MKEVYYMYKNTKLKIILLLVVFISVSLYILYKQNKVVIIVDDIINNNFKETKLSESDSNYYSTTDKNVKYIFESFVSKIVSNNLPIERKYLQDYVLYYDANKYLLASNGAVYSSYSLYNINNGVKINSDCYINTAEGYTSNTNMYISAFPIHNTEDYSKQGLCVYNLGQDNFSYIDLSKDLKAGETFIKDLNNHDFAKFPLYDYKITDDNRKIVLSVFKDNKDKNPNTKLREVEYVLP